MARAKTVSWVNLVAGLVLGATTQPLFFGTVAHAGQYLVAQATGRATQAHAALGKAIECHRQGDYEAAAAYFKEVLPRLADLTAPEQEDFKHFSGENVNALAARQTANRYLNYAEQALAANRQADAAEQVKKASPSEQYMSPDDKQRLAELNQQLRVVRSAPPTFVNTSEQPAPVVKSPSPYNSGQPVPNIELARAKTREARAALGQSNFEACETLLAEAEALHATFVVVEDSPAKVREDLAKAMADDKTLLAAARGALSRKEYDSAEAYAHRAEKAGSSWSLNPWADSPAKVLREIQAARTKSEPQGDKPAPGMLESVKGVFGKPESSPYAKPTVGDNTLVTTNASPAADAAVNTEVARKLLNDGRAALKQNDFALARQCAEQARGMEPRLQPSEDSPGRLLDDVARAEKPGRAPKADVPAVKSNRPPREEALELLRQGREQLGTLNIDDAMKSATQAKALTVKWGLFEDTPDTLIRDVEKARAHHNQDESVRVLAEGRKLLDQKDYDGALKAAYRAQTLHGTYYIWDLGDRPENLIADVTASRGHSPADRLVVKKDNPPPAPTPGNRVVHNDANVKPVVATDVRPVTPPGGRGAPGMFPDGGQPIQPIVGTGNGPSLDPAPVETAVKPVADTNRGTALRLLGEARKLLEIKDGNLIENLVQARLKCLEAEKLHVTFTKDEESPGELIQRLAVKAGQRVQSSLMRANDLANDGAKPEAQRYQMAEDELGKARDLTAAFGLDTQLVDGRLAWVRRMKNLALAGPKAAGAPDPLPEVAETPRTAAQQQGFVLLDEARKALRGGKTIEARKVAEEAAQDQYAVTEQAFEVLREIDKEEFMQKVLQEQQKFKVVESAFNRGDFANARALLDTVNTKALNEKQHDRLKEILQTPDMQPTPEATLVQGQTPGADGGPQIPEPPGGGRVHISDSNPQDSVLKATEAMRSVQYDKLRKQGLEAQRQATEKFRTGQADAAIDTLKDFLDALSNEHLEGNQVAMLKRPVEMRLEQFRLLKEQYDFQNQNNATVSSQMSKVEAKKRAEESKQQRVSELLKQGTACYRDHKYEDALRYNELALELDPDNGTAAAALMIVQRQMAVQDADKTKADRAKIMVGSFHDVEDEGPFVTTLNPASFPKDFKNHTGDRKPLDFRQHKSPIEREIESKLNVPIGMHFSNMPLSQAIDDLHANHGINFWIDQQALDAAGISANTPVSINLEGISLKSALTLLLKNLRLTYIIKTESVLITTPQNAVSGMERRTIQVADLVIPIENSTADPAWNHYEVPTSTGVAPAPTAPSATGGNYGVGAGSSTGSPSGASPFASLSNNTTSTTGDWNKHKASKTQEETLINLITNSVDRNSWDSMGGPGTIQYFAPTMSLVINQTVDIQEQIQDLLASLRALQDQEVAIEVRFITIADDFYERIGVDFNMDIQTNKETARFQPSLLSGVFSPQGFLNNVQVAGKGIIAGITPAGTLTSDLSIPINANSFNASFPQFGGYIPGTGGLNVGLAFLSDIQVFLFLEAVAGDVRTNVMTAPKLTLENGQIATITVGEGIRNFLTSINYSLMNGQIVAQPIIQSIAQSGVSLQIQAVISADRRFVRMNPQITLTNTSNTTPTAVIPVQLPLYPTLTDFTGGQQPVLFTEYLSAPSTNFVNVNTTVTVPDGGTVLMGGLKIMSEGRNEYGAPILSKIPYIDRLFRNTSYGRDSRSLMLMVTPRIIIQAEEEVRQTGVERGGIGINQ